MSIVTKLRTWLGLDQQAEMIKQQSEVIKEQANRTAQLVDIVKELKSASNKQPEQPVIASEPDTSSKELILQLQNQVASLQQQLVTAREEAVRSLFSDFRKSQDEEKEKHEKAGRPRIDGRNINLRVDVDTYNMLQFLSSRKAIQKTRYINDKLREGLMADIQSDPVFSTLYNEYTKPEKIESADDSMEM